MRKGYVSDENVSVRQRTESAATTSGSNIGSNQRLLQAEWAVVVLDRSVTFAGRILEALAIEDFHASASVLDQAGTL